MKKGILILLAAFFFFFFFGLGAHAEGGVAKIGDVEYESLQAAVDAAEDGATITMIADNTNGGVMTVAAKPKNVTIDLNGHKVNVDGPLVGSAGTVSQSLHFEKGSNITITNGTITTDSTSSRILFQNYADLTLTDVIVDATNMQSGAYALSNNNGKVTINGSSSILANANQYAFDACWGPKVGYPDGTQITIDTTGDIKGIMQFDTWGSNDGSTPLSTVTIKNGYFDVKFEIEAIFDNNLFIEGGTFTEENIDEYIVDGLEKVDNGDGTWTVKAPEPEVLPAETPEQENPATVDGIFIAFGVLGASMLGLLAAIGVLSSIERRA